MPDTAAPGYKMRYCKYYDAGMCSRGACCTFAHGLAELRGEMTEENQQLIAEAQRLAKEKADKTLERLEREKLKGKGKVVPPAVDGKGDALGKGKPWGVEPYGNSWDMWAGKGWKGGDPLGNGV